MAQLVKIVIPLGRATLSEYEQLSIGRCFELFARQHPIVMVKPQALDLSPLRAKWAPFDVESFDDRYFERLPSYNRLMLSPEFYARFTDATFIFIHQPDVYCFRDELAQWCDKGYDYIGAPWLPKRKHGQPHYRLWFALLKLFAPHNYSKLHYRVGNGGASLRRTAKLLAIAQTDRQRIAHYLARCQRSRYNEDVFWAVEANRSAERLSIPHYATALAFAFDQHPREAWALSGGRLPFCCHGWFKPQMIDFWRPLILERTQP